MKKDYVITLVNFIGIFTICIALFYSCTKAKVSHYTLGNMIYQLKLNGKETLVFVGANNDTLRLVGNGSKIQVNEILDNSGNGFTYETKIVTYTGLGVLYYFDFELKGSESGGNLSICIQSKKGTNSERFWRFNFNHMPLSPDHLTKGQYYLASKTILGNLYPNVYVDSTSFLDPSLTYHPVINYDIDHGLIEISDSDGILYKLLRIEN